MAIHPLVLRSGFEYAHVPFIDLVLHTIRSFYRERRRRSSLHFRPSDVSRRGRHHVESADAVPQPGFGRVPSGVSAGRRRAPRPRPLRLQSARRDGGVTRRRDDRRQLRRRQDRPGRWDEFEFNLRRRKTAFIS